MKRPILLVLFAFGILLALPILIRTFSSDEDTWICVNGGWVKHGNPSFPMPTSSCGNLVTEKPVNTDLGNVENCQSSSGKIMAYSNAKEIAIRGCVNGILQKTYFCNSYTGTWWIDFTLNQAKEGCNPACVVDVEKGTAEVNWRCTGLAVPGS